MLMSTENMIQEILKEISDFPTIQIEDIPSIDLYMDQVTTFMEDHLGALRRTEDEKILTKTMINNYAKNHLLPPPEKKKYSREHILILTMIYYFKSILSLQDIQDVLSPLCDIYFRQSPDKGMNVETIYREVFSQTDDLEKHILDDISYYEQLARNAFPETASEDQDFMTAFSLICSLGLDMYIKKKTIEKIIDRQNTQRIRSAAEEKTAKKNMKHKKTVSASK